MVLLLKIKVKSYSSSKSNEKSVLLSLEIWLISKLSYCSEVTFSKHTPSVNSILSSNIAVSKLSYVLVTFTGKKALEIDLKKD